MATKRSIGLLYASMKTEMTLFLQIMTAFFWVLMGGFCAYVAQKKGRDMIIWFFLGMLFGIFALLTLLILPPVKEEQAVEAPKQVLPSFLINKNWFYLDLDHNQNGPVSVEELAKIYRGEGITDTSYVWSEGMENWVKIAEQTELKSYLDSSLPSQ